MSNNDFDLAQKYIENNQDDYSENRGHSAYSARFAILPSIALNYHINNNFSLGFKTTYSPKSSSQHSSTSDFHILFSYIYLGYQF